jgi:hypothetical protein
LGTLLANATISNIVGLPTGAFWNAASNSISVSPATSGNAKNNPYTVRGTATKADGSKVDITLTVDIDNSPTLVAPFTAVSAIEDAAITVDVLSHFAGSNGDTLQIADAKSDQGTVVIAGKNISVTRKAAFTGDATVEVTVADGRGGTVTKSFSITVKASAVDAPTTINLKVGSVTPSSAIVACGIVDADGSEATCMLKTQGAEVMRWQQGEAKTLTGLTSGAIYTVYLDGFANSRKPDSSVVAVPVNQFVSFTTTQALDTTPPVITLNGAAVVSVNAGFTYTEPGATWTDHVDGSGVVTDITGTVNTGVLGTYTRTYRKTDAAGNTGTANRTVNVVCPPPLVTFPDGTCG